MSRLAREHPEDDRYQSLEGQREVLSERIDKRREDKGFADRLDKRMDEDREVLDRLAAPPDLDFYEGKRKAIMDRIERQYKTYGPNSEERRNLGMGNDD